MKNLFILFITLSLFSSCITKRYPNINSLRIGISETETKKALGEYNLVLIGGKNTNENSVNIVQLESSKKDIDLVPVSKEKYWLFFVNHKLKLIQWGIPTNWNWEKECDRLLVSGN